MGSPAHFRTRTVSHVFKNFAQLLPVHILLQEWITRVWQVEERDRKRTIEPSQSCLFRIPRFAKKNVTYTTIGSASGTLRATIEAAITGPGIRIINIQNTAGIGTVKNAKNIRCALLRGEIRKLVNVGLST